MMCVIAFAAAWLPALPLPRKAAYLRLGGPVLMTDAEEGPDMDLLGSRIRDQKAGLTDCKLYVMQCMVPGQRLTVTAPPELVELFTVQESPQPVVVLGRDRMAVHTHGVELSLTKLTPRPYVPNIHPEGTADLELVAGRVCEVRPLETTGHRWLGRPARGRWLELDEQQVSAEVLARSERLSAQAGEWTGLARAAARGRYAAQLDAALADLGPMPDADRPNTRALWVAGLINPVSKLGLALEVRPQVLMAPSVDARLSAVERVLSVSISKLQAGDFDI
uniref:Lon N-terminal domain-containing protein n=1 Tax=Phaeocystis antarctica TaxID=33657 RepID=A0A7S0F0P8_9EUKA